MSVVADQQLCTWTLKVPPISLSLRRGTARAWEGWQSPQGAVWNGCSWGPMNGSVGPHPSGFALSQPTPRCPKAASSAPSCLPSSLTAGKLGFLIKKEGPWKMESFQEAAGAVMAHWARSSPRCGARLRRKPLETSCSRGAGGPQGASGLCSQHSSPSPALYLGVHYKVSRP